MASSTTYVYVALGAPRTIRLMQLHPGGETDPIHLSLVATALDSVPDFESISYCWGNEQDKRQVTCDGASLSITNSLFTGLAYFRYADRPRTLWADAICINQADAMEKSNQVLLMPQIYSQATRTLVWLGIANDPAYGAVSPSVADSIRQAVQLLPEYNPENALDIAAKAQAIYPISQQLRAEGKPNILDHDWSLLTALLKRPWFRRKWVIQEVALAKEVALHAGGGVEILWPELAKLAFSIELLGIMRLEVLEFGKSVLEPTLIPLHCVSCVFTVQIFRQQATLLDGVLVSMHFHCTDPRDHIYSLLSLGCIGPSILPDYNASASEVFRRFAIAILVQGLDLKLLSLAADSSDGHQESKRLEGLPSWVPDLRITRGDRLVSYTVRPQAFSAGGRGKPVLSVSHDQNILQCQGQVIDSVKKFSTSLVEMMVADMPELKLQMEFLVDPLPPRRKVRLAKWLQNCYQLAFGHEDGSDTVISPGEELMAAFSRTITCGMDVMRNRLPPELIAAFPRYMNWAIERTATKHEDNDGRHSSSFLNYSVTIDESIMALAAWLKFCVTENGRFGHVPLNTQPGDRICVLLGGEVPFIIRPTGKGTYTLIGECYVDGIMDGETFEAEGFEDELETICFE
ncbi:heterokaryon incompatibility protein-domain-containing protein [Xylaria curta]|nr:heterokaryon incompatibility protein-domain-containing protein [Xylaria curta]